MSMGPVCLSLRAELGGAGQGQDLQKGLLTAPVIFALRGLQGARLKELIETEFDSNDEERIDEAMDLVLEHGIGMARELALDHALAVRAHLASCPCPRLVLGPEL